jgi:hypothetical protein
MVEEAHVEVVRTGRVEETKKKQNQLYLTTVMYDEDRSTLRSSMGLDCTCLADI